MEISCCGMNDDFWSDYTASYSLGYCTWSITGLLLLINQHMMQKLLGSTKTRMLLFYVSMHLKTNYGLYLLESLRIFLSARKSLPLAILWVIYITSLELSVSILCFLLHTVLELLFPGYTHLNKNPLCGFAVWTWSYSYNWCYKVC